MSEREIDLGQVFRLLKRKLWLIILMTLVGASAFWGVMYALVTPVYESQATLLLTSHPGTSQAADGLKETDTLNDLTMYQKLMKSFLEIGELEDLQLRSAQALGYEDTDEIISRISLTNTSESQLITVTVRGYEKETTRVFTEAYIGQYKAFTYEKYNQDYLQVLSNADVSDVPVEPNTPRNLAIGGVFGLALALVIIISQFILAGRFYSETELEETLELSVIGTIPKTAKDKSLVYNAPASVYAESYRTLRSNIEFSVYESTKTFLITSSVPGEGKSTTALNLAQTFTFLGKKVLLIDADLRKPTIHTRLGLKNLTGLSAILTNNDQVDNTIQQVKLGEFKLDVMTSGKIPLNPSELLSHTAMDDLLEVLKERYDLIIVDTSPVLAVTDSQVLAKKLDATILVSDIRATNSQKIIKAKSLLDKAGAKMIGSVINKTSAEEGYYYYYSK